MTQNSAIAETSGGTGASAGGAAKRLYEEILARTEHVRKRSNLARVWAALEHLRKLGSQDFSIANVGRAIQEMGHPGPKTQSIRNAEGRDYRELITSYAKEFGTKPSKALPAEEEMIAAIPDLRVAAMVRLLLAENASLKRRNDLLHHAFSRLAPQEVALSIELLSAPQAVGQPSFGALREVPTLQAEESHFSDWEKKATQHFLDNLGEWEVEVDAASGALVHQHTGLEVAPPGFGQVLKKVLGSHRARTG